MMHPVFVYLGAAVIALFAGRRLLQAVQLAAPVLAFVSLLHLLSSGASGPLFHSDKLSLVFAYVFLFFSFAANLFSLHLKSRAVAIAGNLYAGSALGAVLAGDFVVFFVFWEIMALASAVLVWNHRRPQSLNAVFRYLLVHAAGGLFFFAGLLMHLSQHPGTGLQPLSLNPAGMLIFAGFALNAALIPFHAWLPDAYPSGSAESSVYLSAFTTKVAVYAFARFFAGEELLVPLGAAAAVFGVIFALMENDIRRLLSYHIVCQVGYMVVGIGLGSELGINAGVGHAIGNILFKGLLFMATGAVLYQTSESRLSHLGGLYPRMKTVFFFFITGALAIAGAPLLNGFVTKGLLISAAFEEHQGGLALVLLAVAVGTFLSIACKLAYFCFFHAESKQKLEPLPWNCHAAMTITALACLVIGVFPEPFLGSLPYPIHVHVYTLEHVLETLQLLLGTFAGFLILKPMLHTNPSITIDIDVIYRKFSQLFVRDFCSPVRRGQEAVQKLWTRTLASAQHLLERSFPVSPVYTVGSPLLWMTTGFLLITAAVLLFH